MIIRYQAIPLNHVPIIGHSTTAANAPLFTAQAPYDSYNS